MAIGKAATTEILGRYENPANLFKYDNNWLRYVYDRLNAPFEDFGSNQLAVITFNYDRTVEHFLHTSLKNSYGKTNAECAAVLQSIPVIHLHGRLAPLPWQSSKGRPYDVTTDPESVKAGIENIKIIHEDIRDGRDKDFARAKDLIAEAEQVLFLGFGYGPTNIERLGVADMRQWKAKGTTVGLIGAEVESVRLLTNGKIDFCGGDCLDFLREQMIWN